MTEPKRHQRKILIVDDDALFCSVLKDGLSACGYQCETALNGETAIELLKAHDFDLLMTDMLMPGIDGFEVARRAKEARPDLPVAVMTAVSDDIFYDRVKTSGVALPLEKPFTLEQLGPVLDALFADRVEPANEICRS